MSTSVESVGGFWTYLKEYKQAEEEKISEAAWYHRLWAKPLIWLSFYTPFHWMPLYGEYRTMCDHLGKDQIGYEEAKTYLEANTGMTFNNKQALEAIDAGEI